jgi:hypothetical protein
VDYVKLQLQSKHGLPADKQVSISSSSRASSHCRSAGWLSCLCVLLQELELAGKAMADPLSLSDFPSLLSSGRGVVRVLLSAGGQEEEEKEPPAADEASRRQARDMQSLEDEELA